MVRRCNSVGVRVYVDAVLNHMATVNSDGIGSGDITKSDKNVSYYVMQVDQLIIQLGIRETFLKFLIMTLTLLRERNARQKQEELMITKILPMSGTAIQQVKHKTFYRTLERLIQINWVLGLTDLWGAQDYVRDAVAAYLNDLIDIGVAG